MYSRRVFFAFVFLVLLLQPIAVAQPKDDDSCAPRPGHTVADFAMPVPDLRLSTNADAPSVLATLKQRFGIRTIVRYYDHHKESIDCKTLLPDETKALIAAGFSIAVVFQHNGHRPQTFLDPERGAEDAERALKLAEANGQPFGTTIYFSVDGPEATLIRMKEEWTIAGGKVMTDERKTLLKKLDRQLDIERYEAFLGYYEQHFTSVDKINNRSLLPFVKRYFQSIKAVFTAKKQEQGQAYEVGAYGSGITCRELLRERLVAKCWLAAAMSWPESPEFDKERVNGAPRWSLAQKPPTKCPSWRNPRSKPGDVVEFDLNRPNPAQADFGQWPTSEVRLRTGTRQVDRPETCRSR